MNAAPIPDQWQSVIGLAALPAVLPLLVEHLKSAIRCLHAPRMAVHAARTPWPLVTDVLAVAWALALRDAGLLGEGLHLPSVILLGLASGAAAGLGYDGWQRLRARVPQPNTGGPHGDREGDDGHHAGA